MTEGHGAPAHFLAERVRKAPGGVWRVWEEGRGRGGALRHRKGIFSSLKMTPLLLNG